MHWNKHEFSPQKEKKKKKRFSKILHKESLFNGKLLLLMISKLDETPACDELFAQFSYLLYICSPLCNILLVRMIQYLSPCHLTLKSPALKSNENPNGINTFLLLRILKDKIRKEVIYSVILLQTGFNYM